MDCHSSRITIFSKTVVAALYILSSSTAPAASAIKTSKIRVNKCQVKVNYKEIRTGERGEMRTFATGVFRKYQNTEMFTKKIVASPAGTLIPIPEDIYKPIVQQITRLAQSTGRLPIWEVSAMSVSCDKFARRDLIEMLEARKRKTSRMLKLLDNPSSDIKLRGLEHFCKEMDEDEFGALSPESRKKVLGLADQFVSADIYNYTPLCVLAWLDYDRAIPHLAKALQITGSYGPNKRLTHKESGHIEKTARLVNDINRPSKELFEASVKAFNISGGGSRTLIRRQLIRTIVLMGRGSARPELEKMLAHRDKVVARDANQWLEVLDKEGL